MSSSCHMDAKHKGRSGSVTHLVEHTVQLITSLANTVTIVAIHHKNQSLSVLEVMPPQRPDLQMHVNAALNIALIEGQHILQCKQIVPPHPHSPCPGHPHPRQ